MDIDKTCGSCFGSIEQAGCPHHFATVSVHARACMESPPGSTRWWAAAAWARRRGEGAPGPAASPTCPSASSSEVSTSNSRLSSARAACPCTRSPSLCSSCCLRPPHPSYASQVAPTHSSEAPDATPLVTAFAASPAPHPHPRHQKSGYSSIVC